MLVELLVVDSNLVVQRDHVQVYFLLWGHQGHLLSKGFLYI